MMSNNPRIVFADTAYWIALIHQGDDWHKKALKLKDELQQKKTNLVTTDGVLSEVLSRFSRGTLRPKAAEAVREIMNDQGVEIIPQTRYWFLKGLALYEKRSDKKYSLQDCISMEIIRARSIIHVLTSDRDFEQENFIILMKK